MSIPTVYRSTDTGAPTMNRATVGSAILVLDACLRTGYGSKSPAGWTKPYTGSNKAVFQNAAGHCVRVEDASAAATGLFTVRSYRAMSDVDTGDDATHVCNGFRSPAQRTNAARWVVVADEDTFYFSATDGAVDNDPKMLVGGGRYDSFDAVTGYDYFALGLAGTNANNVCEFMSGSLASGDWGATSSTNSGLSLPKDHSGTSGPVGAGLIKPKQATNTASAVGGYMYPRLPAPNSADAAAMAAYIIAGSNVTSTIRGRLRGIYVPLFYMYSFDVGDDLGFELGGAGSEPVAMQSGGGFNTASTWGGLCVESTLEW
jgi:hypothetical protein